MRSGPDDLNSVVGDVIRGEYTKRGLTLERLATASGIPYGTLRRKIAGGAPLYVSELIALARIIGVDPGAILDEAEQLFRSTSGPLSTPDVITERVHKHAEARELTPARLLQTRHAATDDPELLADQPGDA